MATQLIASGSTAATSNIQTIGDYERHVLTLVSTATDPLAVVEVESDTDVFVRHLMLSDFTEDARMVELLGPMSYRVRRPAGFGACSIWSDQ